MDSLKIGTGATQFGSLRLNPIGSPCPCVCLCGWRGIDRSP